MKDKLINFARNVIKSIKKFFTTNFKMKLLVAYLVANLAYITIGSYIFMTKQINPNFDYKSFSLGLRNILVLNVIVFLVICLFKRYKKNWVHLAIIAVAVVRRYFNIFCF